MKVSKPALYIAAGLTLAVPLLLAATAPANADICDRLWYQRNQIYADAGYCFKTARARAVWGRNCFPPYGQLTPREQAAVSRIERMEIRNGCK